MITKIVSIPLLRNISPWTWPHDYAMSLSSDCQAAQLRRDPTRRVYQQSPRSIFMNFQWLQMSPWILSWHFLVLLTGSTVSSQWTLFEAASRLFTEALVSFSLEATEISLTLHTTTCTPKSPSACHCHRNLWKSEDLRGHF